MSSAIFKPRRWAAWRWALPLLWTASIGAGCESSKTDGADLQGVFDGTSQASAASASASAPKPKTSVDAAPPIAPLVRDPPSGPCVQVRGKRIPKPDRRIARRPGCRRARVMEWRDGNGTPRYACLYAHRKSEQHTPLPLVLFFHGELDDPRVIHRKTRLRARYGKLDLTGDPKHPGFLILAPQGRRVGGRIVFDTGQPPEDNVDLKTVDHFVDTLLAEGSVDRRQIYAVGDSGGGTMAALYAMARPRRIAAFATYGTDASAVRWTCEGQSPPAAILYRACDTITPCADVEQWLGARQDSRAPTFSLRLGASKATEPSCVLSESRCRKKKGTANHNRWPKERETEMLEFLSRYSLVGPPDGRGGSPSQ